MRRSGVLAGLVVAAVWTTGCCPRVPIRTVEGVYTGPTLPLAAVVEGVNQNNRAIESLWARQSYEIELTDDQGRRRYFSGDGVLLYLRAADGVSRPDLRLVGNKDFVGTVFDAASNDERFWLIVKPELETMWWGQHANVGRPCMQGIPVRPDLLAEVLGVGMLSTDLLAEPAPVMRFNHEADAYVVVWSAPVDDDGMPRRAARREVWYDRATLLPIRVELFDNDGRVVVSAQLTGHVPVDGLDEGTPAVPAAAGLTTAFPTGGGSTAGGLTGGGSMAGGSTFGQPDAPAGGLADAHDRPARVAGVYSLLFVQSKTTMRLTLRDVALERNGVPNERSIRFPDSPGVSKVIQVDADCPPVLPK